MTLVGVIAPGDDGPSGRSVSTENSALSFWNNYYVMISVATTMLYNAIVGRGGALVETITFNRRVVCSTPALAAT